MELYRKITTSVDGFEGDTHETYSYVCVEDNDILQNDDPITQEEVVEADVVFLEYDKYESFGTITDEEISTLKKFKII